MDLPTVLIDEIDQHFGGMTRGQEPLDRCLWFDPIQRNCKHYEFRPQLCRDYELRGIACLLRRQQEYQQLTCESETNASTQSEQ
jgi:Fe-S-cluster containining protein